MTLFIILLIIIIVGVICTLIFYSAYTHLTTINTKIQKSNEKIVKQLKKKYDLIKKIDEGLQKSKKKKNYLKDFDTINLDEMSTYDLDKILNENEDILIILKDDEPKLFNKEMNEDMTKLKSISQKIIANKKYFNKNNDLLIKSLKKHYKLVAKIARINTNTSYEIKEPTN